MWLVDLLIVLAVFLYNLPIVPSYSDGAAHLGGLVAVSVMLCLPYLLRRRHPTAVLGIIVLAACIQLLLGAPVLAADVMMLFAIYNLSTSRPWWISLTGTLVALVWLMIATLPHLGNEFLNAGEIGVLTVVAFWVWTWGILVRTRRAYVAGLRERAEQAEQAREAATRIAVADERARIAREIHDVVSHSLSVVILMSEGAAAKVSDEPDRARSAMVQVRDTGRTALADMRRMLGVLREDEPGSDAPQPGIDQLDTLINQSKTAGLPVALTIDGDAGAVTDGMGLTVYRLVQEALTNVRRHAGPDVTLVDVSVSCLPDAVRVHVTDDGDGLEQHEKASADGHGLVGMRERVAAYGGTLTAGPHSSGGFEVLATLPREVTR
nr:sensor histidine kinase [Corynebacterium glyciniphilum]